MSDDDACIPYESPFDLAMLDFYVSEKKRQYHDNIIVYINADNNMLKIRKQETPDNYTAYYFHTFDIIGEKSDNFTTQEELCDFLVLCKYPLAVRLKRQYKLASFT